MRAGAGRRGPVLARDHRRRRQALGDLLRHVRAREDGDRAAANPRGETLAGLGVEPFREAEHRRIARQRLDDLAERLARHGGDDDVHVAPSVGERDRFDPAEVDALQVARIPAGLGDRSRLLARAARQGDLVPALEQDARERRPPGPRRRRRETACSGSFHEVDRDRHAVQAEALAQPVLDPVAVVARDEAGR